MNLLLGFVALFLIFSACSDETDTINANVYIHDVAVGGMNRAEAEAALAERFQVPLEARELRYLKNGEVLAQYTFADFGARFDFTPLIDAALTPRRGISRLFRRDLNESPGFIFNAEKLESIIGGLSKKFDTPAINASFSADARGQITVSAERTGSGINTETAAAATQAILISLESGDVALEFFAVAPTHTTADFDFAPAVLGNFGTYIAGSGGEPRVRNITRAAERINNSVIYPGETFSAGAIIAANLPDSGYETAVVLVRGQPVEDVGGGVCQVVSTLYNAVLHAELTVLQRHNHSARVSYVEVGFDATVAGDYFDLKFKNTTTRPVLITSRVEYNRLYVQIHGYETRAANRTLRFEAKKVEILPPEPYREVVDAAVPRGVRRVTLESQMGYHVELYKIVYIGGTEVSRENINTSVYKPLQGIIAIGAG
ncbi:MAG: VanW family protein [Defluviitaleaceae bacterium]|nr:VanW family protein [Defluviitaleaceae bacterium]